MEQSVDVCVDVLGAGAGSAGSELLLAVAWRCLAPCASWGCFQHRSQISPSSSCLEIRQPGPSSCRQGKEK